MEGGLVDGGAIGLAGCIGPRGEEEGEGVEVKAFGWVVGENEVGECVDLLLGEAAAAQLTEGRVEVAAGDEAVAVDVVDAEEKEDAGALAGAAGEGAEEAAEVFEVDVLESLDDAPADRIDS